MIGDQADVLKRLKDAAPPWFGNGPTPSLDTALSGFASIGSSIYSLIQYALLQTRIGTSTDGWLDLAARDFFGLYLQRRANELDASYSARILAELRRPRITRSAVSNVVRDLTGIAPYIFEPARCADTGAFGTSPPTFVFGTLQKAAPGRTTDSTAITSDSTTITCDSAQPQTAFAGVGAWGSLLFHDQFFIKVFRPPGAGIPNVAGFSSYADPTAGGGYSFESGFMEWVTLTEQTGAVTDAEIYATIARNIAANATAWAQITPFSGKTPANLSAEWIPVYPDRIDGPQPTDSAQSIAFVETV